MGGGELREGLKININALQLQQLLYIIFNTDLIFPSSIIKCMIEWLKWVIEFCD